MAILLRIFFSSWTSLKNAAVHLRSSTSLYNLVWAGLGEGHVCLFFSRSKDAGLLFFPLPQVPHRLYLSSAFFFLNVTSQAVVVCVLSTSRALKWTTMVKLHATSKHYTAEIRQRENNLKERSKERYVLTDQTRQL